MSEEITRKDRSPYVKDNNYGDIKGNELQKMDKPVMSKIEYSATNDVIFEDYTKLDEYLEKRFIPTYILLKKRKNANGETEFFQSIRLHHIMALRLSEAELEHVMEYLKKQNIRVGGKGSTLDNEFENYDYVNTYKDSELPSSVPAAVTLQKIKNYKQNNDEKLRQEIITDNMRLVPYVSYRYAISTGINIHELDSYGYEGLINALEKFDINYGCAFSTYAVAYIRGSILNGIAKIRDIKNDNFYYNYINAKLAVEKEYGLTLSEAPELIEEVIELLVATGKISDNEYSKKHIRARITAMTIGNISLNDEELFEELLYEKQLVVNDDYVEDVLNSMSKETINQLLDTFLTEREAKILKLKYGFYNGIPKSHVEIGKILGLRPQWVGQIVDRAIRKLRNSKKINILKDFYDVSETETFRK